MKKIKIESSSNVVKNVKVFNDVVRCINSILKCNLSWKIENDYLIPLGDLDRAEQLVRDCWKSVYNLSDEECYLIMSGLIELCSGIFHLAIPDECEVPGGHTYIFKALVNACGRPAAVISESPDPLVLGIDCSLCGPTQTLLGDMIEWVVYSLGDVF